MNSIRLLFRAPNAGTTPEDKPTEDSAPGADTTPPVVASLAVPPPAPPEDVKRYATYGVLQLRLAFDAQAQLGEELINKIHTTLLSHQLMVTFQYDNVTVNLDGLMYLSPTSIPVSGDVDLS